MALQSLTDLKNFFKTNFIPTQQQFWDMLDSFRHKNDKVAATDIDGLTTLLAAKASNEAFQAHLTADNAHASLFGELREEIQSQLADSTTIGDPSLPIPLDVTGNAHCLGVGPGTYPEWGGMVIPDNNQGTLRRVEGVFSVSLIPVNLTGYAQTNEVYTLDNRLLNSNKTIYNSLPNAVDPDFPPNIFNLFSSSGSKILTIEPNVEPSPFDLKLLPEIFKYQWINDVEEKKFEFAQDLSNGFTFSIWMKKSELVTNGCTTFSIYAGAWIDIVIPPTAGGINSNSTLSLTFNQEYGDWINLVFKINPFVSGGLNLKFNPTLNYLDGFFHIANVFGHIGIVDVEPFTVRSKYTDVSLAGFIDDKLTGNNVLKSEIADTLKSVNPLLPLSASKGNVLYKQSDKIFDSNRVVYNKLSNGIDYDYPPNILNIYAPGGTKTVTLEDNPSDSPFDLKLLPKILKYQWTDDFQEKKFDFSRSWILGANGLTFSFWLRQTELVATGTTTLSFYDGTAWRTLAIPVEVGDFSTYGASKLELNHIYGDWVNLVYTADETIPYAGFMLKFDITINYNNGVLHIANVLAYDDIISVDPFSVRSKYKDMSLSGLIDDKITGKNVLKSEIADTLKSVNPLLPLSASKGNVLYKQSDKIFDSNRVVYNKLSNGIDYDYPPNILNIYAPGGTKTVTLEDNPSDSPFDSKLLPKILKYQWTDDVEEKKFDFSRSWILGANGLTFSFWLRQTELVATGTTTLSFYDGTAWRTLAIPVEVGEFSTYGVSKLELNHIYGDWVNLVYTADETIPYAGFMLKFDITINYTTGFFHIANILGYDNIIDVDPFTVRSKYKDMSLSGLLYDKNAPLDLATWGDSVTAGTDGDETFSYQYYLRPLIAKKYNIINCGVGGENVPTIAARQGGLPAYTQYSIALPADQTPVIIGNDADSGLRSSYDYSILYPLKQWGWAENGHSKINPCYIDGQKCIMKYVGGNYTLERYEPVSDIVAAKGLIAGSILMTNACKTVKYADLNIIFVGINGGWSTPQDLADKVQKMIDFCDSKKYIVMTQYVDGTSNKTQMEAIEIEFYKRFASNAIFLRRYFITHALYDAGLTNTSDDITAIAAGLTPPQLLADGTHPTQSTYNLIAKQIYQKMIELGYI